MGDRPREIDVVRGETSTTWVFVVRTVIPMPVRLSVLFGEWLYELRAALDGIVYYLAVRDSGQSPPPAERGIYFPVFVDAAKYDDPNHRGRLKALSDETFALLRHVQPFNAEPDHRSNMLWWIEELARIVATGRDTPSPPTLRRSGSVSWSRYSPSAMSWQSRTS